MPAACERRSGDEIRVAVGSELREREASISCIGEAVKLYSACFDGTERIVRARASDLNAPAIRVSSLLLISERQYRTRDTFNRCGGEEIRLPDAPDESGATDWMPVWALTSGQRRYARAAYCFLRYPAASPDSYSADSDGCAAGPLTRERDRSAFCELVERDAITLWWYDSNPAAESLAAATSLPARAFHLDDRRLIKPGKRADLLR